VHVKHKLLDHRDLAPRIEETPGHYSVLGPGLGRSGRVKEYQKPQMQAASLIPKPLKKPQEGKSSPSALAAVSDRQRNPSPKLKAGTSYCSSSGSGSEVKIEGQYLVISEGVRHHGPQSRGRRLEEGRLSRNVWDNMKWYPMRKEWLRKIRQLR